MIRKSHDAHLIAGKQALREHADHGLERDETLAYLAKLLGETDERSILAGIRIKLFGSCGRLAVQFEGDRKAEIWNERERMRWINGKRRENRKNMCQEMLTQPFRFRFVRSGGSRRVIQQLAALAQFTPPPLCSAAKRLTRSRSLRVVRARKPVLGRRRYSGAQLPRRPATRTMKNSSRLSAEIDRNRSCSRSGGYDSMLRARTRRLNSNQDNSRLIKRAVIARSRYCAAAGPSVSMMEISAAVAVSTAISLSWPEISKVSSIRSSLTTVAAAGVFIVLAGAELLFVPRPGPATRFPQLESVFPPATSNFLLKRKMVGISSYLMTEA